MYEDFRPKLLEENQKGSELRKMLRKGWLDCEELTTKIQFIAGLRDGIRAECEKFCTQETEIRDILNCAMKAEVTLRNASATYVTSMTSSETKTSESADEKNGAAGTADIDAIGRGRGNFRGRGSGGRGRTRRARAASLLAARRSCRRIGATRSSRG